MYLSTPSAMHLISAYKAPTNCCRNSCSTWVRVRARARARVKDLSSHPYGHLTLTITCFSGGVLDSLTRKRLTSGNNCVKICMRWRFHQAPLPMPLPMPPTSSRRTMV